MAQDPAKPKISSTLDDREAEALLDAMSPVLGLAIKTEWRAPIVENLKTNTALASLVLQFTLPDDEEPAAVFRP